MRCNVHLMFKGECEAAFAFYRDVFAGTITTMLRYGDTPMSADVAADWQDKIVHATLTIGDAAALMGVDVPAESYRVPQGFHVLFAVDTVADAERVFGAL